MPGLRARAVWAASRGSSSKAPAPTRTAVGECVACGNAQHWPPNALCPPLTRDGYPAGVRVHLVVLHLGQQVDVLVPRQPDAHKHCEAGRRQYVVGEQLGWSGAEWGGVERSGATVACKPNAHKQCTATHRGREQGSARAATTQSRAGAAAPSGPPDTAGCCLQSFRVDARQRMKATVMNAPAMSTARVTRRRLVSIESTDFRKASTLRGRVAAGPMCCSGQHVAWVAPTYLVLAGGAAGRTQPHRTRHSFTHLPGSVVFCQHPRGAAIRMATPAPAGPAPSLGVQHGADHAIDPDVTVQAGAEVPLCGQ